MIRMQESPDSRDLHYGASGGGQTLRLTAITTAGETESQIWIYALQQSDPYFNGFIRQDIKVRRGSGPNHFTIEIEYGPSGVGGGDQPLGGVGNDGGPPDQPTGPESQATPLTSGWSFSIQAPTLHIEQSLVTLVRLGRDGDVDKAPDYKGRIGVDRDGTTLGCDVPPPARFTFSRTVAKAVVTQAYLDVLSDLAGKVNDSAFYFWQAGEVLFQSAEGQFSREEGWSITYKFAVEKNNPNVIICDGLPPLFATISKPGWAFLWVREEEITDPATQKRVTQPAAAYVEMVIEERDFSLLEIGT